MRDAVFSGQDVAEAVARAARALGLDRERLRYVVLERGTPAGRGLTGSPARIAVLLEGAETSRPAPVLSAGPAAPRRPRSTLSALVPALGEAAGLELTGQLEETEEGLILRLGGADRGFFLEQEGEVLKALEHVLHRVAQAEDEPRRLIVECEGYRAQRDQALRERALALARAVRADGRARRTEPLNAYERRVVHLAVAEVEGVKTYSVGEGSDRRVTVAPAVGGEEPAPPA